MLTRFVIGSQLADRTNEAKHSASYAKSKLTGMSVVSCSYS